MSEWVVAEICCPQDIAIEAEPEEAMFCGEDGQSVAGGGAGQFCGDAIHSEGAQLSGLQVEDLNAVVIGSEQDTAGGFSDGHITDVADLWFSPDSFSVEVIAREFAEFCCCDEFSGFREEVQVADWSACFDDADFAAFGRDDVNFSAVGGEGEVAAVWSRGDCGDLSGDSSGPERLQVLIEAVQASFAADGQSDGAGVGEGDLADVMNLEDFAESLSAGGHEAQSAVSGRDDDATGFPGECDCCDPVREEILKDFFRTGTNAMLEQPGHHGE